MKVNSIKDIDSLMRYIEKKYNIFSFLVFNKIPYWTYIRSSVFQKILENNNLSNTVSPSRGLTVNKVLSTIYTGILNFVFLLKKRKVDFLFFETPRRIKGNEPYLSPLYDKINTNNYLRFSYTEKWTYEEKNILYLNFLKLIAIFISLIFSPFFILFIGPYNYKLIKKSIFDLKLDKSMWFYKMKYFELIFWYLTFMLILKITKPKKVFIVSNTFYIPLIAACDKFNIKTFEVQHGVISKYSSEYNLAELNRKFFFPSYLLLLGSEWKFVENFLPQGSKTLVLGSSIASEIKRKNENDSDVLLFISQKTIRKDIIDFINNNKYSLSNYKMVYKVHPMEYNDSDMIYSKIPKELHHNFQIICNEINISKLFDNTLVQIGSYSAAMLEGIQRNIPTLIIKTPLSDHLHFIRPKIVKIVTSEYFNGLDEYLTECSNTYLNNNIEYYSTLNKELINEIITI